LLGLLICDSFGLATDLLGQFGFFGDINELISKKSLSRLKNKVKNTKRTMKKQKS
jgi:hypothetical protein